MFNEFNEFKNYKASNYKVALIIPGRKLLFNNYGSIIDNYDICIRLNTAPTIGYEKHTGSKTSLRVLNYPSFLRKNNSDARKEHKDLDQFYLTNNDKNIAVFLSKYVKKKDNLIKSCMNKDTNYQFLFIDYLFIIFELLLIKNFMPKLFLQSIFKYIYNKQKFSIGFIVINLLIKEKVNFTIFGIDFNEDVSKRSHYYKNTKVSKDHDLSIERKILKKLYNKNKFKIYF